MTQETKEEITLRVKKMIITAVKLKTPAEKIDSSKPLFGPEGVGLDSIDALELVVSLEKEFGVRIPDANVGRVVLVSVDTIVKFIQEKNSAKSA